MSAAKGLNLWVFRSGRRTANGEALKNALLRQLRLLPASPGPEEILASLLQAGELECALADSGADTTKVERITDDISAALVNETALLDRNCLAPLDGIRVPHSLTVSVPEGFAYYALHPLAFADVLREFPVLPPRVSVIGIRSIGTTLSAVTSAALRARGIQAVRMTVRPTGHPYNRRMEFSAKQLHFIRREIPHREMFLIVDEGPGLSGSSFLSVAEALVQAGAAQEKIILITSHAVTPDRLCAENSAARWQRFRFVVVPSQPRRPSDAQLWIGGGEWRRRLLHGYSEWPASWPTFERPKYLSRQNAEPRFYKFAGFGCYGNEVFQREEKAAAAGFGPAPKLENDGYISYPFVDGRPMRSGDLSPSVLARLAAYCAFRKRAFAAHGADITLLQQMAKHNLRELGVGREVSLRLERGVIPDGRMQPHEWLLTVEDKMVKTDTGNHGDDHFFPGATDIAWDLAGAIVEWQMNATQAGAFLRMYHRASGDNAQTRIEDYITAYTIFRCSYCTMAANAMQGSEEQARLDIAAANYGSRLLC